MRGTWNPEIIDNPILILAVLGWALGFVANRFWFDWGDGGNSCLDIIGVPGCPSKQDKEKMNMGEGKAKKRRKKMIQQGNTILLKLLVLLLNNQLHFQQLCDTILSPFYCPVPLPVL